MGILETKSGELYERNTLPFETVAIDNQKKFMTTQSPLEAGLRMMIQGLEQYVKGYEKTGCKVGEDGYSKQYVVDIAYSLIYLLSGPGKFDGGTLDSTIREICKAGGIELV